MMVKINKWIKITQVQVLALEFIIVIFLGAILLSLPIASVSHKSTNFIDCLFVSTSSTCVTGLVTVDTGTHWSYFGKTVILFLIEIGGLGFMTIATLIALLARRKIDFEQRIVMQESMNLFKLQGIVKMTRYILVFTFSVQSIGALILSTQFIPMFGIKKGIYYSIFHSISAFCNAGIDLFGGFRSLTSYYNNSVIILTIGSLIVIGGLGFFVWSEIYEYRRTKKLSTHSKVVISTTLILIIGGSILMYIFEYNNYATMGNMIFKDKALSSFFASVTPRTAGFNSISTSDMTTAGRFLTIILMFIGGSPGSTAGGIKTTTLALLVMTVLCVVRGKSDTEIFKRRIDKVRIYKAFALTAISLTLVVIVTMILCITEKGASLEYILYEVISAFGTVGLTLGLTTKLSTVGKIAIIITMYCGRMGPLTVATALSRRNSPNKIKYPKDKILIG
ncbi:TrkH family potassium uptake protein [Clostridium sp. JN-1]|jgi:trk system potassium uptake protein TrkH|uniref:TrkH family potassium uptake protein n=1 Tax=Clostridium sp. JN-1 TaxID=2483110 RepID=UPI000F0BA110|nr:TrkH family potassium uptake protein [Clostridium sp. JN-1]